MSGLPALLGSKDGDLKIVIKWGPPQTKPAKRAKKSKKGGDSTEEVEQVSEKSYLVDSALLSRMSKFVDAALNSGMMEQTTREIVLHCVTPSVFELALTLILDPLASRSMTTVDAVVVLAFYDMYSFDKGKELCDQVLMEYFVDIEKRFIFNFLQLSLIHI